MIKINGSTFEKLAPPIETSTKGAAFIILFKNPENDNFNLQNQAIFSDIYFSVDKLFVV